MKDVGPTSALSVTFLVPVFGVLWSVLFLDEHVSLATLAGGAVVLAGTLVTLTSSRAAPTPATATAKAAGVAA